MDVIRFVFRRKTGRTSGLNKNGLTTAETSVAFDDDQRYPSKSILLPTSKPPLSSHKPTTRLMGQDIPPALPPRKPLDKKNSVQMPVTIPSTSVSNDGSSHRPSTSVDETSSSSLLAPGRILPSKEVRRRRRRKRMGNLTVHCDVYPLDGEVIIFDGFYFSRLLIHLSFRFEPRRVCDTSPHPARQITILFRL